MANIILDGFNPHTFQDLARVLSSQGHRVTTGWQPGFVDSADAVFCSAEAFEYPAAVRAVRVKRPDLPVIVVTACAEQAKWLDGLEAGATDYCCAPFETTQLSRLLAGILGHASKPSAVPRV